jgi:alpha-tubulin suppressor-like RCC1 family protein
MSSGYKNTNTDFDSQYVRREFFTESSVWGWGRNELGQFANGSAATTNLFSSPIVVGGGGINWQTISATAVDWVSTSGVVFGTKSDGTVWSWGTGTYGQLGNGAAATITTPTAVSLPQFRTGWKKIVTGGNYTIGIWQNQLWGVGSNAYGQLGNGLTSSAITWVQCPGTTWQDVSASYRNTLAIKTDGTLWVWGQGIYGQMGDNTTVPKSSPIQTVAGGTNWASLVRGNWGSHGAIKTDGTLWLWGYNLSYNLGVGDSVARSSPTLVVGGGRWKTAVIGGQYTSTIAAFTAGIKTDGTLWMWGVNSTGQIGDNVSSTVARSTPVQVVGGGTNWKQVSLGKQHSVAVKTDGTLWSWGLNNYGQLGDNTTVNKSSPVQTVTGGTTWRYAYATQHATLALTDNLI